MKIEYTNKHHRLRATFVSAFGHTRSWKEHQNPGSALARFIVPAIQHERATFLLHVAATFFAAISHNLMFSHCNDT
ncbi:unnamed protein product [Ectocarpus sp. 12 AP-2014]